MVYFSNTFGLGLDDLFAQTHDKILLIAVVLGKKKKEESWNHVCPSNWSVDPTFVIFVIFFYPTSTR